MLKTSVCIVGAGPAGLIASLFLSKNKVPHILVEREAANSDKVCGENYDGLVIGVLNKIDQSYIPRMLSSGIAHELKLADYINSKGIAASFNLKELKAKTRLLVNRTNFDAFLFEQALQSDYITFKGNTSISSTYIHNNKIYLSSLENEIPQIEAEMAIIATGDNSLLTKKIVSQKTKSKSFILAIRGYYTNLNVNYSDAFVKLYLIKKPCYCYLYIRKLPNELFNVEVAILKRNAIKFKVDVKNLLFDIINNNSEIKEIFNGAILHGKLKGASLSMTSTYNTPISAERIVLAGSCAIGVNPITSWGMGEATYQGMIAGEQYLKCASEDNFSANFMKQYDKRIKKRLIRSLFMSKSVDFTMKYLNYIVDKMVPIVASNKLLSKIVGKMVIST